MCLLALLIMTGQESLTACCCGCVQLSRLCDARGPDPCWRDAMAVSLLDYQGAAAMLA